MALNKKFLIFQIFLFSTVNTLASVSPPILPQVVQNKELTHVIQKWEKTRTQELKKMVERAAYFEDMVSIIFRQEKVPEYFFHLALLLTGYENKLFQKSMDQNGIWLLSEDIAKRYGLKITSEIDERLDPIRSTKAVAQYLNDLYLVFQDWNFVWVSFFMGERKVLSLLMKSNSRNWENVLRSSQIPKDIVQKYTDFHVYKKIYEDKKKSHKKKKWDKLKLVQVSALGEPLFQFSKKQGIPYRDLIEYNPHLLRQSLPKHENQYALWIPQNYLGKITKK